MDILDLATETSLGYLQGPPLVGGAIAVSPDGATVWVNGSDACLPQYRNAGQDGCPLIPGSVLYAFRFPPSQLLQAFGAPAEFQMGRFVFTPDGGSLIVAGRGLKVYSTRTFAQTEEWARPQEAWDGLVLDPARHRVYLAERHTEHLHAVDLDLHPWSPKGEGLLHHWAGDGTPADRHGGVDGVMRGGAAFEPGLLGQAFALQSGSFEVSAPFNAGTIAFAFLHDGTLMFWIRSMPGTDSANIVTLTADTGYTASLTMNGRGRIELRIPGLPVVATDGSVRDGVWHLVSLMKEKGRVSLWVDGQPVASGIASHTPPPSSGRLWLRFGPFPGLLDEVVLSGRAPGAREMRDTYESGTIPARPRSQRR